VSAFVRINVFISRSINGRGPPYANFSRITKMLTINVTISNLMVARFGVLFT